MAASRRLRVLVAHVGRPASFIRRDLELLAARFEVQPVSVGAPGSVPSALRRLAAVDCVVGWFGSTRFLPLFAAARLLRKPVIVIAGGYDLANLPAIRYGNMRPGRRAVGRQVFRLATRVACVSQSAAKEARENAGVPADRVRVVYHAFDPERQGALAEAAPKEPLVLTVAGVDESTLRRKGLLTVARTSRLMPDIPFVIAGACSPELRGRLEAEGGPGLSVPGYVSDLELDALFRRAAVYFQPSLHEAFGCSVAEAMLYNCTPVVTPCFALPEVVGACGLYIPPDDPAAAVPTIRLALRGVSLPEPPRERIRREFPPARRQRQLIELVEQVCRVAVSPSERLRSPPVGASGPGPR